MFSMRTPSFLALNSCVLLLCGCSLFGSGAPQQEPSEDGGLAATGEEHSVQEEPVRETPNVTYAGRIAPAGISVYQQGTHRLVLADDRFILLESDVVDLNGYVGEDVEAFGAIRPTVEEGGIIMRVENIRLKRSSEISATGSTASGEKVLPDAAENGRVSSTEAEEAEEEEMVSSQPLPELPVAEEPAQEEPTAPASQAAGNEEGAPSGEESSEDADTPAQLTAVQEAAITAMAKDSYAPDRWTQQYCTGHIGFCIPVHKNWWFKSFGNTTFSLWHLELNNAKVENIGDGVIMVKLLSGTVASRKATDRQIRVQGSTAIGFRDWENGTHFEVSADARLQEAVTYITNNLTAYEGE